MTTLSSRYPQIINTAENTTVDASTFNNSLGTTDTDVQTAVDAIDDLRVSTAIEAPVSEYTAIDANLGKLWMYGGDFKAIAESSGSAVIKTFTLT